MLPDQPVSALEIGFERDVVLARRRARQIAETLGFDLQDQSRVATAVSEIVRNAYQYAGGGRLEFFISESASQLVVRVTDRGPGIPDLTAILAGKYVSRTGMGVGIIGARRLTDRFEIDSRLGEGTTVVFGKDLPRRPSQTPLPSASRLAAALDVREPVDMTQEIEEQNQELLRTLDQLRARQAEVERLNQELAETNRGVVALYAELDGRAQDLARAADLKARVLSDISHEVRTPLNAVLNITRLLLDRTDGDLTGEQERQVRMIRDAARTLSELVNDLLDLARMEAGKTVARISDFSVVDLFAALRGMFRPLLSSDAVTLVFEDVGDLPHLHSDEGKIGQILRNLIANALKFTERGEIRVAARVYGEDRVAFTVADTGIGIPAEDQEHIFLEFSQVENPLQRRSHGTGLGLPLSRKLAEFLGGSLAVQSEPGQGSAFTAVIPQVYSEHRTPARALQSEHPSLSRPRVEAHDARVHF